MERMPPKPTDGSQDTIQLQVRNGSQEELFQALEVGDAHRVEHLLQGNEHLSNQKNQNQQTPLIIALSNGHSTIVEMLLNRFQADSNETDEFGNTPLHTVCEKGNYEALKMYLKCVQVPDINAQNKIGDTPLMKSSQRGFSVIAELLLQHNADPNIPNHSGRTALMEAVSKGHKDVVQTLLKHGADVLAVMDKEYSGMPTAFYEATKCGSATVLSLIVQAFQDAVEKSSKIFTCKTPNEVTQLMKSGVKLDQKRGDGRTPLMVHAKVGNDAVVQVLIQHKAPLNSQDKAGKTALMISSYQGHINVVRILVQHAALLNIQCKAGKTALIYATMGKHLQIVKHLCVSGADTGISDENGKTAKEVAAELLFFEIEQYLCSNVNMDSGSLRDPFILKMGEYLELKRERHEPHEKGSTSARELVPRTKEQVHTQKTTSDHEKSASDFLSDAYKRIAELETRIQDLTIRQEYTVNDDEDLAHYQGQPERMMEEFRRMKIVKRKAEQFAIEAKQAAQKLSVDNSRLQEQVARDKYAHELMLKNILRELEAKSADTEGALQQKVMVLEKSIQKATLEHKPNTTKQYSSSSMMQLLFKQRKTMHMKYFFVAVCGLPYSGKSTLLKAMIPESAEQVHGKLNKRSAHRRIEGMDVYELGYLVQHGEAVSKEWLELDGEALHMYMLTYAFAEDGIDFPELEQWTPPNDQFKSPILSRHFQTVFEGVKARLEDIKQGRLANILHQRIVVMNVWDIGISRALYDVLPYLSIIFDRRLLINVLNAHHGQGKDLSRQPYVHKLENEKERDIDIMRLHSRLHYYLRIAGCAQKASHPSAVLVGTHADSDSVDAKSIKKLEACIWSKAADMGVSSLMYPSMLVINAKNQKHCAAVRKTLETIANDLNELEYDMPLTWIFLRTALYHYPSDRSSFLISREELRKLASEVGITTENEFENCLQVFTHTGSIIYHKNVDSLCENIILKPEHFLQTLSQLYTSDELEDPVVTQHREDALKKGIVCRVLINLLWKNEEERDFLVQLAEDARMAAKLKSNECRQSYNYQIRCPTCQDEECYFMPALRDTLSSDSIRSDLDSMFVTFSNDYVPTDIQGMFVKYLPAVLPMKLELQLTETYNQTVLLLPKVSMEIKITVHGEVLEINLKPPSGSHELNAKIKSALKTVCIHVLEANLQYHPGAHYQLGVVCPGSDFSETSQSEGLHYLHFLPHVHQVAIFCMHPQCRKTHELGRLQLEWIHSEYLGPTMLMGMHGAGYISNCELNKVIHLIPLEKIHQICRVLGVTCVEVNQLDIMHCINKWQRLSNSNRKETLAKLLFKMECYEAAMKLDARFLMLNPDPVKLSDLQVEVMSQHMFHWEELAKNLGVVPERVAEIRTQNKLRTLCCRKLLEEVQPDQDTLYECLIEMKYFGLVQYLESGHTVL